MTTDDCLDRLRPPVNGLRAIDDGWIEMLDWALFNFVIYFNMIFFFKK